jgi:hypothetical protein
LNKNYIHFFLILNLAYCNPLQYGNKFELAHRNEDFIIFNTTPKKIKIITNPVVSYEKLYLFFKNIYYLKSNPIVSDKFYIFDSVQSEKISSKIFEYSNSSDHLLIIFKREEPMAPFSRIYRTCIIISFLTDTINIQFTEIEKYYIFGNQFTYTDWSFISDENECNYKNNLHLNDTVKFVVPTNSKICKNGIYNDFTLFPKDIISNKKSTSIPRTTKERLDDLDELKNNKMINDKEYNKLREKILNEI